ncbi:MAG: gamma-glutamylcyclotransferase [Rhodocyclaceae bacterium]|nr:MAG: gamma-glutamylcyclotransferase [Rhodocyclaceae bacterium]
MTDYFAYGSNMSESQMMRRCPQASLSGKATLAGHDFLINGSGFATIVPEAQTTTFGILWTLSDSDILSLDEYEGIDAGHYVKERRAVLFNGQTVMAMVYIATDSNPGVPERSYLESIVDAASAHRLPPDYVRRLAEWLSPPA